MKILGVKMHGRCGGNEDFVYFRLSETNYIDLWSPTNHSAKAFAYHTPRGSFVALSTMTDAFEAYRDYGFIFGDSSTAINKKHIFEYVDISGGIRVFFKDGSFVDLRSKRLSQDL